ncbi:MAG: nucleotidyltransferase domain-containing protein [Anaerolineae bacterium]
MEEQGGIRQVVLEEAQKRDLRVLRIVLCGSRARRDHRRGSDWDVYVVVTEECPFPSGRTWPRGFGGPWLSRT